MMFDSLLEALKIKAVNGEKVVQVDDQIEGIINELGMTELLKFVTELKNSSKERKELFVEYNEMAHDSVIGGAIELLSDDSTQLDSVTKSSVWATSKNPEIAKGINEYLKAIKIEEKIWAYAYNIVKYGELYLKTYNTEFTENEKLKDKLGYFFEIVDNPYEINDLQEYGDTVGYGYSKDNKQYIIYPTEDYIHFINDRGVNRKDIEVSYDEGGQKKTGKFKVRYGTSFLESSRVAYKIVDLLETIILSVRYGRSNLYRIFKIEVGASSRAETVKIMRDIKNRISTVESMNTKDGLYSQLKKPVPHGENIYLPTRNGKGDVNIDLVGGDYEIKDIVDIEYFRNKEFAALKIPKAFLGFEETMPGGIGNQSLTRIDIRYARTARRIKAILANGILSMVEYWCSVTEHSDWIGNFEIATTELLTAESSDEREEVSSKVALVTAILDIFRDKDIEVTTEMIQYIIDNVAGIPELANMFTSGKETK